MISRSWPGERSAGPSNSEDAVSVPQSLSTGDEITPRQLCSVRMVFEREGAKEGNNVTATHCILIPPLVITMLLWTAGAAPQEDVLKPYDGPSVPRVDPTTLAGKVMTGYQGWFNCPDDGADLGWTHWARDRSKPFGPGNITVDLWPDVSEYDDDELYATGFTNEDGTSTMASVGTFE
jgi:hypothetical protein